MPPRKRAPRDGTASHPSSKTNASWYKDNDKDKVKVKDKDRSRPRQALRLLFFSLSVACIVYILVSVYFARRSRRWSSGRPEREGAGADDGGKRTYVLPEPTLLDAAHVDFSADEEKREAIRDAFKFSWSAYTRDAFGSDEYHPISRTGSNLTDGGAVGYTIVDALDTLLLMGLREEYERAREWVSENLSFDRRGKFNSFETTIRLLGGLLSAYHLSANDPLYLHLATDLADRLVPIFDTPTGIPYSLFDPHERKGYPDPDNHNFASVAEAATLQLEFKYLAHLTGNYEYWEKAERVMQVVRKARKTDGLVPIFLSTENGQFFFADIRLGSRGDSYYEYLLKQWLQTNRSEPVYREMYDEAANGIKKHLVKVSSKNQLVYTAELQPRRYAPTGQMTMQLVPKQDHLVCFIGGSFMLGSTDGQPPRPPLPSSFRNTADSEDWVIGHELTRTCVDTYLQTKTGLGAEIVHFYTPDQADVASKDWYVKKDTSRNAVPLIDARYILRPETVESLFIAFHLSGDPVYRRWGWAIFEAIEKHCKVETGGYASVRDVNELPAQKEDRMETFWLSETLKYLYLLFSDQTELPLDKYVFNTEAHPLPIFNPVFPTFAT